MDIVIGTAQFGSEYGIANTSGKVHKLEAKKILDKASQFNINSIDTANAYGDSESLLGKIGVNDWKVHTKLTNFPDDRLNIRSAIYDNIQNSLSRLRIEKLEAVLIHNTADLKGHSGAEIAETLKELKEKGIIRKIGFSIYSPEDLHELINIMQPDIIQAPLNVIDQRLLKSGWLAKLKEKDIEIHVRSVFLQGLLLMKSSQRPVFFQKWKELWKKFDNFVDDQGGSATTTCLGFIKKQKAISKIVIGFDNLNQFEEIFEKWNNADELDCEEIASDDPMLINPYNWN